MSPNERAPDVSRALLASGFTLEGMTRYAQYAELRCETTTRLGARVKLMIALSHEDEFAPDELEELRKSAEAQQRACVLVAGHRSSGVMAYEDLFAALGGEVPSWRALAPKYGEMVRAASNNVLPTGETGEAWLVFEVLVRDGLEFCLGRRAFHYGGLRRGVPLTDVVAELPDRSLVVVDAKAETVPRVVGGP